ncbi:MAG: thioredoxin TrxC [Gammaproteobacteria bacterium]|nr:thioredoxin TrxC [Gammaproteobacteria bacterium]MBL7000253.1 thioredoxin TrxC [Gammaproteobacteria bacterium]
MSDKHHVICASCGSINNVPQSRMADDPKCGKCKQAVMSGKPLELNEAGFQRYLEKSDQPLLVDFWAPWCGPCKMMAPIFTQAATQLEPQFRLIKINTEVEQILAGKMRIQSIPTLAIFKNGKEMIRQPGAMGLNDLLRWARTHAG